jgi:hypothetical protein
MVSTSLAPQQADATAMMTGAPVADAVAQVMQAPPGEDSQTGQSYDLATILPVLKKAYLELLAARDGYTRADKYFKGISPEVFADPNLRRLLGLSEDTYALNYAAIPVKAVANRMAVSSISVPGDEVATNAIAELWDANGLDLEEHVFTIDTLKYGDNYLIAWPKADGSVQISPNNPLTTRLFYDPEDSRTKTHAVKSWLTDPKTVRTDLYFPGYVYKFVSYNQGKLWQEWPEPDGGWPMVNPYGAVPVFHFRAGDSVPYGTPEHADAYGPQDGLVKTANTLFAALDFLGFPQRYALVEMAEAGGTGEFSDFDQEQPDSFITDDAGRTSGLRQGPGELWALRAREVGQFTPAQSANFLSVWGQCITAMAAATQTPMRFFTDPTGQHPSGDSLRASDIPLKQKIGVRRLVFAAAWRDTLTFALRQGGLTVSGKVRVTWKPLNPTDDQDAYGNVPAFIWKIRAGVPLAQVYRDTGYTQDEIDTWDLQPADFKATPPQPWPFSARSEAAALTAEGEESPAVAEEGRLATQGGSEPKPNTPAAEQAVPGAAGQGAALKTGKA